MGRIVKLALSASVVLAVTISGRAENVQPMFEQASEAFKAGNYGSAELLFRKVSEARSGVEYRDRATYYLALSIFNQKKYKAAIFEFNRFLLTCTTQDLCQESRYWIAECYFNMREYLRAIEEYKRFTSQSKNEMLAVASRDRIAEIYYMQGRYEEAIIEWKEAINGSTDVLQNNRRVLKISEALYYNENYDDALELLESLLHSRSEKSVEASARLLIGRIYQMKGRHRDALRALYAIPENMIKDPPFCDTQYLKAVSSIALGDIPSAKTYLESFLLIGKSSDWYYDAKYQLGIILLKEGNEKAGIELLDDVRLSTRKMGLRSKAAMELGRIYLRRSPEEAIPYLEDAVSLEDPAEQKDALLRLSKVYIDVKRYEDAERILNLLVETYPFDKDKDFVQFLMSRVALERKDVDGAIAGFEKTKSLYPTSTYAFEADYYLGICYDLRGQHAKAIESIRRYVSYRGSEKKYEAMVYMSWLYLKVNDIKNAEKSMQGVMMMYVRQPGVENAVYDFASEIAGRGLLPGKYHTYIINNFSRSDSAGRIYLQWGNEAYGKKDYTAAEKYYAQYLSVDARQEAGAAFMNRMICLYQLGRYREVIAQLTSGKIPPVDDAASKQLNLLLGRSYFKINNYEMAYKTMYTGTLNEYGPDDLLVIQQCAIALDDLRTALAVPALLQEKREQHAESLYHLGKYYASKDRHEIAIECYTRILYENPAASMVDTVRIELAEIYIKHRTFAEAIRNLQEIKDEKLLDRKDALLIITYFRMGKINDAIDLTKKNINRLLKLPEGETVIKENLFYYYLKGDVTSFKLYAAYLGRYSGNSPLVNYLSGKLYFEVSQYDTSYYYFNRLAQIESEYRDEAYYNIGMIILIHQKNVKLALFYFNKLSDSGNAESMYVMRARLNIMIIMHESGNGVAAGEMLKMISEGPENATVRIQADNLSGQYGIKTP